MVRVDSESKVYVLKYLVKQGQVNKSSNIIVDESRHTQFFHSPLRTEGVIVHPSMERPIGLLPFFLVVLKMDTIHPKKI